MSRRIYTQDRIGRNVIVSEEKFLSARRKAYRIYLLKIFFTFLPVLIIIFLLVLSILAPWIAG